MVRLVPRIELNVVTGFLGSGKTTLLKRFLSTCEPGSTLVIINEYGRESIDDRLAVHLDTEIETIAHGCLCCTVLSRLHDTLLGILTRRERGELPALERIVLETSGLADPAPILATVLSDVNLNEYIRIGTCVATFDALNGSACAAHFREVACQLVSADRIVLTKADLAGAQEAGGAVALARDINPLAEVVDARAPGLARQLFVAGPAAPRAAAAAHRPPLPPAERHTHALSSFSITCDAPLDWASFSVWLTALLNRHGERILRFKSVLVVSGMPGRLVIHGVRHKVYAPEHLPEVAGERAQSRLVFITHAISEAKIRASLERFVRLAQPPGAPSSGTLGTGSALAV